MKTYSNQTFDEYYIDFDTPNKSFLKLAMILEAKGIKNNLFFLKLYNKRLKGVDPYSKKLTKEEQMMIFRECFENRWYFYREVFRVGETGATTDVGGGSEFLLNRGNLAYLWASELNISTYMILPRQMGKTWAAIADATWVHHFNKNSSILHFNKNQTDANDNLYRIRQAISMLPMYMQHSNPDQMDSKDKRLIKNNEKTVRNILSSTIIAMASAGNESKADALARGKTSSKIWYDELAFIFFNSAIYTAATPAYETAREKAIKNNIPYGISITTTPGDLACPHGAFAYKFMNDSIKFNEEMYDYKAKKLYDIINNTPDKVPFVFIQFDYMQLGKTEEWFIERAKKMNNPLKTRREYLLEWINTNGNSPFDPDDVELIGDLSREKQKDFTEYKITKYFPMSIYEEYHGKKPVIISVDVSSGLGRDSSAVVVVNPETLKPMAFFKSNMITAVDLKKLLVKLVVRKYPNCILTIENNSIGASLISELRDTSIARCLYKERKKRNIDQGPSSFTKKRVREVIEYGHNINSNSRAKIGEILESVVHSSHSHVGYPELYDEIRFLELKNGRIDHGSATHDDITMAYMGALYVIRYGTGLKGRGIYYNLRDNDDDDIDELTDNDAIKRASKFINAKRTDEDDYIEFLGTEQQIELSGDLIDKENAEYLKELDKYDGIIDDDDVDAAINSIPEATQRLMLRNYYSMLNEQTDDMVSNYGSLDSYLGYD